MKLDHDFVCKEAKYESAWEKLQRDNKTVFYNKQARAKAKEDWIAKAVENNLELERVKKRTKPDSPLFPGTKVGDVLGEFLDPYEIMMVTMLYPTWEILKDKYSCQEKYESSCFYTKMNYK